jgi:hypothetical protein
MQDLGNFCERNLYRSAIEGMQELIAEVDSIEILNEDNFPNNIKMDIIDFKQTFGVSIDREWNATRGVRSFKPLFWNRNKENFEIFMPDHKVGDVLTLNFELLIRIETNLKLNVKHRDGTYLINQEDHMKDEIHFMRLESVVNSFEIRFSTVFKLLKEIFTKPELKFESWVITDFDNFLNGNPHII